jgi:hypothetical protein
MAKDVPPWYHGNLTADEATRILTRFREPGAYLLRDSQNAEGAYTLSWYVLFELPFILAQIYTGCGIIHNHLKTSRATTLAINGGTTIRFSAIFMAMPLAPHSMFM